MMELHAIVKSFNFVPAAIRGGQCSLDGIALPKEREMNTSTNTFQGNLKHIFRQIPLDLKSTLKCLHVKNIKY